MTRTDIVKRSVMGLNVRFCPYMYNNGMDFPSGFSWRWRFVSLSETKTAHFTNVLRLTLENKSLIWSHPWTFVAERQVTAAPYRQEQIGGNHQGRLLRLSTCLFVSQFAGLSAHTRCLVVQVGSQTLSGKERCALTAAAMEEMGKPCMLSCCASALHNHFNSSSSA